MEGNINVDFIGDTDNMKEDINKLRSIKTYRGIRHANRQKVRGQRGRSNGRGGLTLGVKKKK